MFRQALPLVLLLSITSTAGAATGTLQKVISDLLRGTTSSDTSGSRCESVAGQQRTCKIPAGYRAEFVRQLSTAACTQGRTLFISESEVVVADGCRAEFRLVATGANGNVASGNLETVLAEGLRAKLVKPKNEYGSLYDVDILTTKVVSQAGAAAQVYEGTANSSWGGRTYPLEYTARIDARTGQLLNLDYRYRNPNATGPSTGSTQWLAGTALDAEARTALSRAIRADYQKRYPGKRIQVVTNTAYKEQAVTRSDYRFNGLYGVSIDDGNWQTFRYSARIFLPRNAVSELETNAQNP
jgi:hypothetical protein